MIGSLDSAATALLLVDMQNDFLHPEGAYGRAGVAAPDLAALPDRLARVADAVRAWGGWIAATQFTLVPGKAGEPFIAPHLERLRPFLGKGDFAPGSFGQAVIADLQPVDLAVEKVAFDAFYQSRLEFTLRKAGIRTLAVAGIVTGGGVASTLRGAHVRDFETVLLSDGCAAFDRKTHEAAVAALSSVSPVATCAGFVDSLAAGKG